MKESDFVQELISVIVPVYNVEKYVDKCIESIINQTYKNLEIILVDDGSTDNSGKICDEYAKADSRVVVMHKNNGGLSDARNTGINEAKGRYITFVDSDDYIDVNMIELMYERIFKDNSDMCMCNFCRVDEKGTLLDIKDDGFIEDMVLTKSDIFAKFIGPAHSKYVVAVCKLYKKEIFDEFQYVKGKTHEDEFIVHHILNKCNKISCMKDVLYYYLKRDNSIMNSGFSINRMDAVEAILERTKFAIEKGIDILTEASFINAMEILAQGYAKLDKKDSVVKKRLVELKKLYNELYHYARKTVRTNEWKLRLFVFYISPQAYTLLCAIKRGIVK